MPRPSPAYDKYVDFVYALMTHISASTMDHSLLARMFSQIIFDAPSIFSGKASAEAIRLKVADGSYRPCADHHNVRQNSGERLVRLMQTPAELTRAAVDEVMQEACSVHYVTATENQMLRKYQAAYGTQAYAAVNLSVYDTGELFTRRGRRPKEWYKDVASQFSHILNGASGV